MWLDDLKRVWLVDFGHDHQPGERPTPTRLIAKAYCTGQLVHLERSELSADPPYPLDGDALLVCYDASGPLGCHLALGWPMPARILDLKAEFRCLTSGHAVTHEHDLSDALAYFGLHEQEGIKALEHLLLTMAPLISPDHALLRGRYMAAVAHMEALGVPIDLDMYERLRGAWERVRLALISQVNRDYGVFDGTQFNVRRWAEWLNRNHIRWPRLGPRRLDLSQDTFREMALTHPEVGPIKELRATLSQLGVCKLTVGSDGRNRCPLRPFASKTGRNQPSTTQFIFGPAVWLRGLIKPKPGMAVAYVDYEQQEFGIAAALSGDAAMAAAYLSGDPYLTFAKQAGAVPADATKNTHRNEREKFKQCALGVQYGMGARSLAQRLDVGIANAQEFLRLHKTTYPAYWRWSKRVGEQGRKDGRLTAAFGWRLNVSREANLRSIRNFPLQANAAEMLRLACIGLTEAGVGICAPVHDALLIEAPAGKIEQAVARTEQAMQRASEVVLDGFRLRTEATTTRYPDRYMDPRGRLMWETVLEALDGRATKCA
jgi:hypothetical protein